MANKRITTTDLDFDDIKLNLKLFLQGQSDFTDYDFDGSAMSTLLDVLAYNTHYNALYKNLAVNESFIDSASKRSSVVSRAKEIGYVPYSAKCSQATVNIVISNTTSTPSSLIIPAYSTFLTSVNQQSYNFYTLDDNITTLNGSTYTFSNINIKEGTPFQVKFTVASGQRYIIPNDSIDLSTLKVRVQDSVTSGNFQTFVNQESILNLTATDAVYFVKEIDASLYELEFGNNVVGKALSTGNIISLNYLTCNKDAPNKASTFVYQGSVLIGGTIATTTIISAAGGSDIESIESIRYNAPRSYTTQNRAVTEDDYKTIIYKNFSNAQSVSVWGGDLNDPPVYGKVFVSIKPYNATILSIAEKQVLIGQVLKSKNVVSITPEIVDAEYLELELNISVYYNPRLTSYSDAQLKTFVYQTIQDYNDVNLNKFDGIFRFSKISANIDATDNSFVSNIMTVLLNSQLEVKYNTNANYYINLSNPIYNSTMPEQSILTTGFKIEGDTEHILYMEDLPIDETYGTLRLFYLLDSIKTYVKNIGTVNYDLGTISITGLNITEIDTSQSGTFKFIIKPQSNDVVSVRNKLVTIPADKVNVTMILDKTVSGDAAGNTNYTFTSSRN